MVAKATVKTEEGAVEPRVTGSVPTIFQSMNAVMNDVQAVHKGEKNTAPGAGFMFRGIDAVTNAVGPALREHGVFVVPEVIDWHYDSIVVGQKQTKMGHSRLLIRFTWYGPAGDSIASVAAGEAFDSGDKATAKAHSVAFRTAMIQCLALPTDEPDPDSYSYQRVEESRATPAQIKDLGPAFVEKGLNTPELRAEFILNTIGRQTVGSDLTQVEADQLLVAARQGVVTPEQEEMLSSSLGAKPVQE